MFTNITKQFSNNERFLLSLKKRFFTGQNILLLH